MSFANADSVRLSKRGCDVCQSDLRLIIHEQRFVTFDHEAGLLTGYDVVICDACGFIYADGIPDQESFDRYYRDMSKHEPDWTVGRPVPAYKKHNVDLIASHVAGRLPDRAASILDVGVGTGDVLLALRALGFDNLTGLDPSPRTAEIVTRRYGLKILNTPLSQLGVYEDRFDVILLSGVLEHLRDLRVIVQLLKSVLKEDGKMCIAVPDASRFAEFLDSPFQYFSTEHINFFTKRSLEYLFGSVQMALQGPFQQSTALLGVLHEPIIHGIFSRVTTSPSVTRDPDGADQMSRYIAGCSLQQDALIHKIHELAERGEPIIVWGTGSLTMHLLSDPRFSRLNIIAFVDANGNYWGKTIVGIPLIAPEKVHTLKSAILIVSYSYEAEIHSEIVGRYALTNKVILLFGGSGSS